MSPSDGVGERCNHFQYTLNVDRVTDDWDKDGLTIVAVNDVGTDRITLPVKTYKGMITGAIGMAAVSHLCRCASQELSCIADQAKLTGFECSERMFMPIYRTHEEECSLFQCIKFRAVMKIWLFDL